MVSLLLACAVVAATVQEIPLGAVSPPAEAIDELAEDDAARDWRGTLGASLRLLLLEHTTRVLVESDTRRELSGNFFGDYRRSVRLPQQWHDGDSWATNYVGHSIHGGAAGRIWIDRGPEGTTALRLGGASLGQGKYWQSRLTAAAYAGVFSLQFEVGPFSEASIGNVGFRPESTGWVDHVVTPVGGLGWIVVEDALERHVVKRIESRVHNPLIRAAARIVLAPAQALANLTLGRWPWARLDRPLSGAAR